MLHLKLQMNNDITTKLSSNKYFEHKKNETFVSNL